MRQVLDRRLVALRAELDFHAELIAAHTAIDLHEPYWLDTRYQHAMLAAQIRWIEQLLDDLGSGRLVWQDPQHHVDHAEIGRDDILDIAHQGADA